MNSAKQSYPVVDRLESFLEHGNLPPPYDRWGARLLGHLTKPVQVVVTGFERSGKSALIEMMTSQPVIGHNLRVPLVELAYGETEQALFERQDGSVSTVTGLLKDCDCPDDAVRARQELPDTRLIQQDFVEIGLLGSPAQKRTSLETAIARADVMIWCSQDFGSEEQQLWSMVPEHIKDHSILVLTMADRQLMRGVLLDTIARLEPIVAQEFLGLFPVATIQGITAQTSAQGVNKALWSSSGGKQLTDLIAQQIAQGRTADVDQARMFMGRLATRMPQISEDTRNLSSGEMQAELTPASSPESLDAIETVTCETETAAILSKAVDLLQQQAEQVLEELGDANELDADQVLAVCSDTMVSVTNLLETAEGSDAAAVTIHDDLQEGEEMLMLLQLERGEEAALDAVTLLLQIRKEMIEKLAE